MCFCDDSDSLEKSCLRVKTRTKNVIIPNCHNKNFRICYETSTLIFNAPSKFLTNWGGRTHEISPPNEKASPPKFPPTFGGEQRFPPTRSDLEGISLHLWGGNHLFFASPPSLGGDAIMGKCNFPPKCGQFWRGRDTFSPANPQTCKKYRLGGNSTKCVPSKTPKYPPQLGGMSPPKFPPTILKKDRFACDFFSVSPPIGGDKQLCCAYLWHGKSEKTLEIRRHKADNEYMYMYT